MEQYDYEFAHEVGKRLATMSAKEATGQDMVYCTKCHTPVFKHQFGFVSEEWEAQPTFYHRDTNEVIHYCPTCGALLAAQ